jgi:anaphase-promoting complex subunit 4
MEELDLFAAFSVWLRFTIDRLASSSGPATDEILEAEAMMENEKVLDYIEIYLVDSPLGVYFDEVAKEDFERDWKLAENRPNLMETLDKQLQRQEEGKQYMKALPQVDSLIQYLTKTADWIFKNIAEAQRRSVRFGPETKIRIGRPIDKVDSRMSAVHREVGQVLDQHR